MSKLSDVFGDDFDSKYTLKIKSAMPSAVVSFANVIKK
jgi:hypothetical protein